MLAYLIEKGGEVNGCNGWGFRLLHLSALGARGYPPLAGHLRCTEMLLDNGAEVNPIDDYKRTPLDLANIGLQTKAWDSESMQRWRRLFAEALEGIDGDEGAAIHALLGEKGGKTAGEASD